MSAAHLILLAVAIILLIIAIIGMAMMWQSGAFDEVERITFNDRDEDWLG